MTGQPLQAIRGSFAETILHRLSDAELAPGALNTEAPGTPDSRVFTTLDQLLLQAESCLAVDSPAGLAERQHARPEIDGAIRRRSLAQRIGRVSARFPTAAQFFKFCLVGFMGATCDLSAFAALLHCGFAIPAARALAICLGMITSFAGNDRLTFGTSGQRRILRRFGRFVGSCSLGAALNFSVTLAVPRCLPVLAGYPLLHAACGILAGVTLNFALARKFVFANSG